MKANSIRRLRDVLHLTQRELAKKLGVSQASVAQWERGVKPPGRKNAKKIMSMQSSVYQSIDSSFARNLRWSNGWTQREFASMLGVSPGAVGQWETSATNISSRNQQKIYEIAMTDNKIEGELQSHPDCDVCNDKRRLHEHLAQMFDPNRDPSTLSDKKDWVHPEMAYYQKFGKWPEIN